MATETMMTSESWPALGNPAPPMSSVSPEDSNPEWEMISEEENENAVAGTNHVVILPSDDKKDVFKTRGGRPRSATIGHARDDGKADDAAVIVTDSGIMKGFLPTARATSEGLQKTSSNISRSSSGRRTLRRCASTPDLLVSDNAHEVIVEDESDSEDPSSSEEDAELIEAEDESEELVGSDELEESFEVLSDKQQEAAVKEVKAEEEEEPVMIDEASANNNEEETATFISTPSVGTSSWTMASPTPTSATHPPTTSVWGMKKSPSFKDMLAKNIEKPGGWGEDKALTEAKLRDSHRRHHLRVRTKPKFVVADDKSKNNMAGGGKMKHAHSTGDLTKMLTDVEGGHESAGYGHGHAHGRNGRHNRRVKKQLSAMMEEEDEDADFVIGRGSGGGGGGGGGGEEVLGDTDAMDYYHRKEHGSKSSSNKKKERPDEAKRREISVHKKEMQRRRQAASQKGKEAANDEGGGGGGKKKKKNDKGFGGKKERRRL